MSTRPKDLGVPELDAFLQDIADEGLSPAQLAAAIGEPDTDSALADDLRSRLMAALPETSRFERFADTVSQLLDIERSRAQRLLDQLDDSSLFYELQPGIELYWVEGGPRVANAVRGFVRIAAGVDFPEHEHHGEEHVLVLQGAFHCPTQGRTFRPGDVSVMQQGTSHMHIVPDSGPDLLLLSVSQQGVTVGEQRFWPNQVPAKNI